jgi:hypothetical protein
VTGFIKLYRGWRDDPFFSSDAPFSEAEAWLWLLEKATWKDTVRRTGQGGVVPLERGQLHVSLGSLAAAWNWTIKRVRGFIDRLEKGQKVGTVKGKAGTVLTITNYRKYQDQDACEGTPKGTVRAQSGHTQEEGKERKKKEPMEDLPVWLDPNLWASFKEMRQAIKKPMTGRAAELTIKKLESLRRAGSPANKVLEQSIMNSWQGVFPIKAEEIPVQVGI